MTITELIERLESLQEVAGDVEVAVDIGNNMYELAMFDVVNVVKRSPYRWECLPNRNTDMIIGVR